MAKYFSANLRPFEAEILYPERSQYLKLDALLRMGSTASSMASVLLIRCKRSVSRPEQFAIRHMMNLTLNVDNLWRKINPNFCFNFRESEK